MPLKVSSGFHSPFMDGAARNFHAYISNVAFTKPEITTYANRTAEPYGSDVRTLLFEQIIRVDSRLQNAQWENRPVQDYAGNARISKEYRALTKEILRRCS